MAGRRVRGDVGFSRLLKKLPETVRNEMGDILDEEGDELLAAMRRDVPVDTGFLRERLSKRLSRRSLRLRVGFIGKRANTAAKPGRRRRRRKGAVDQFVGKQFYGRIVEFGRKATTVRVTRGRRAPYTMRVRAMAGRPFVFKARPRDKLRTALRTYWDKVLAEASAGVSFDD